MDNQRITAGKLRLDGYRTGESSDFLKTNEQVDPEIENIRVAVRAATNPRELTGIIDKVSALQKQRVATIMAAVGVDFQPRRNIRKAVSAALIAMWKAENTTKPPETEELVLTENIIEGLVAVPADNGERTASVTDQIETGSKSTYLDKSTLIEEVIRTMGVKIATRYSGDKALADRANQSYKIVYIPQLHVGVIYCDAYAQQSFVIHDITEEGAIEALKTSKQGLLKLRATGQCTAVLWNSDTEQWKATIEEVIKHKPSDLPEPCHLTPEEIAEAESLGIEEYLTRPKFARHDVDQLLKASGQKHWDKAYAGMDRVTIVCADGRCRTGNQVFYAATRAFGTASTSVASRKKSARDNSWPKILKIAGYIVQDTEYFQDHDFVRHDLGAFAQVLSADSIERLTPSSAVNDQVTCSDGGSYTWRVYIGIAAKTLGLAKTTKETDQPGKRKKVLTHLLGVTGTTPEEFPKMDKEYFLANLRTDLEAYVGVCEGVTSIDQLIATKMRYAPKVKCANGEMVNGLTYLTRAGRAILDLKKGEDINNVGSTLALLKDSLTE